MKLCRKPSGEFVSIRGIYTSCIGGVDWGEFRVKCDAMLCFKSIYGISLLLVQSKTIEALAKYRGDNYFLFKAGGFHVNS